MKIQNYLKTAVLFLAIALTSCSSESADEAGDNVGATTAITITSSKSRVFENTLVLFTATNGSGANISSDVTFKVNGTDISGTSHNLSAEGNYTVTATLNDIVSNTLSLEAITPSYSTNVLLEDYTGTWCGWCTRMLRGIEDLASNEDVIVIGIHNGDSMAFRLEAQMRSQFDFSGWPTGRLNRVADWNAISSDEMNVNQPLTYLNRTVAAGLGITSTVNGNVIDTTVKVGYDLDMTGTKLIVFALENGVLADQENYTNNYGGVAVVQDYEHNHILKANLSELNGDDIPAANQMGGQEFSKSYSYTATGVANVAGMELVAILVAADGSVVNAQKAMVGTTKDFD
jgi:thiol-disulfide isomerase/thioredoxin